jgi:hypothetical protein
MASIPNLTAPTNPAFAERRSIRVGVDEIPYSQDALMLESATLALNLLADLERARQSGNPRKVAKVSKRLDRLLERLGSE